MKKFSVDTFKYLNDRYSSHITNLSFVVSTYSSPYFVFSTWKCCTIRPPVLSSSFEVVLLVAFDGFLRFLSWFFHVGLRIQISLFPFVANVSTNSKIYSTYIAFSWDPWSTHPSRSCSNESARHLKVTVNQIVLGELVALRHHMWFSWQAGHRKSSTIRSCTPITSRLKIVAHISCRLFLGRGSRWTSQNRVHTNLSSPYSMKIWFFSSSQCELDLS